MRRTGSYAIGTALVSLALFHACEPMSMSDGRFWAGRPDAGSGSSGAPGSGGSIEPGGTGGSASGGMVGSGGERGEGAGGSGGLAATGGAGAGMMDSGGSGGGPAATGGAVGPGGSGGRAASGGRGGATGGNASGGATGSGGGSGSGGASGVLTGTLKVSVTTKSAGGRYEPDNVGAIWIADSSSKFIKSLYVWGSQRRRELTTWTSATSAAGLANNLVDAVTAATMVGHGVRTGTWNATNTSKVAVPDGAYKVCFELRDGSGGSQCVDFMKSRTAQTVMPADTTTFTNRSLVYTP